jgi:hypothetical protein
MAPLATVIASRKRRVIVEERVVTGDSLALRAERPLRGNRYRPTPPVAIVSRARR